MFGFGFYREDDGDDEHKLDSPTHRETILEDNSYAEIPSEESNNLQKITSQSDLGLVNECRNCFEQATMKVKKFFQQNVQVLWFPCRPTSDRNVGANY